VCPKLDIVCPAYDENPTHCDNGDWVTSKDGGYCECWVGYAGDRCSAKLREEDASGCHWDDLMVRITNTAIKSSDKSKIIRSVGGMGPKYSKVVDQTDLVFTSKNLDGCQPSFGSLDLQGKVLYVRNGACADWIKA